MDNRFLGIDFGTKRIGVALSDEDGRIAFPETEFENRKNVVERISQLCKEKEVDAIVVGESTNHKGEDNPVMEHIRTFKSELAEKVDMPIHFENEYFSTAHAAQDRDTPGHYDASAAAIILQRFLDKKNNE